MIDLDTDYTLWDDLDGKPEKPIEKGHCPKCGRHIGRGLHFHQKACDGSRKAG